MRRAAAHRAIETTFLELLNAIAAVSETDEEALAVLACILAEGRLSLLDRPRRPAIMDRHYV